MATAPVAEFDWSAALGALLNPDLRWRPEWYQLPPDRVVPPVGRDGALSGDVANRDRWKVWFLKAGRGTGKTDAGANAVDSHAMGPPCFSGPVGHRIGIVAPTLGSAREVCVLGETGLRRANPFIRWNTNGTLLWPTGARGQTFGTHTGEDVERLRGPQHCLVWCEEMAAWRYLDAAWDQIQFGNRLGPHPRVIITTTPKPRKKLREIAADAGTVVVRAKTSDNPHLPQSKRDELEAKYGGTRLGRQELNAEDLDDVPGALWTHDETAEGLGIIRYRDCPTIGLEGGVRQRNLMRVIVSIDPNASSAEDADEAGITVHGLGYDGKGYLLADRSAAVGPTAWAKRAMEAAAEFGADSIVAEANNGGEMVRVTLVAAGYKGRVKLVHASRGKRTRAEPISMFYEQGRIFHVEVFEQLEDQLVTWTPESGDSPDRLDANVWGWTELMVDPPATVTQTSGIPDSTVPVRIRGDLRLVGKKYVDREPSRG